MSAILMFPRLDLCEGQTYVPFFIWLYGRRYTSMYTCICILLKLVHFFLHLSVINIVICLMWISFYLRELIVTEIKFNNFRTFWPNHWKLVPAKNQNAFYPRNFQILVIREIKFLCLFFLKKIFFFWDIITCRRNI